MPSKSKTKGDKEERRIVNALRAIGISCKRTLEAGARSDGSLTHDIDIHLDSKDPDTATMIGECKLRANGFIKIYKWLGINDFLTIRADRKPALYVVSEGVFFDYLKLKQKELNK